MCVCMYVHTFNSNKTGKVLIAKKGKHKKIINKLNVIIKCKVTKQSCFINV